MILVGQKIGPFEIEKELGSGAMGTVYRAIYTNTGRPVAIKVIVAGLGDNERVQQRFEREAAILKQLKHPNIVRLLAIGKYHRSPFYAMEFIEGEPLDQILQRRGRLTWEEVIDIGQQLCTALQHAHENGIIHRDLKPSNIMIAKGGVVKLTDFGIAKDTDVTGLTSANSTVGTAAYMSPEQCRGERNLTPKSDIYSFGILMYELLTGKKPFFAENAMDMFIQHVQGTFERPTSTVMDIPIWLDNLVCQCMEKKPEHRPLDAKTVAEAMLDVKQKVETVQSVEGGTKKLSGKRKTVDGDSLAAPGGRKRKRKTGTGASSSMSKWLSVAGLSLILVIMISLLVFLLQPASAEQLYQAGMKLVQEGDKLFDDANEDVRANSYYKWKDAEEKYFNRILSRDPNSEWAGKAQAQLDYIKAGKLFLRGEPKIKSKDWVKAKEAGFDDLLQQYPQAKARNAPELKFIQKARELLAPFEAPKLFEVGSDKYKILMTGRNAYDPLNQNVWNQAKANLGLLVERYLPLEQDDAKKGAALYEVLIAFESAIHMARNKRNSLNEAETLVIKAIEEELKDTPDPNAIRELWMEVKAFGDSTQGLDLKAKDIPKYRGYIKLAEERLFRMQAS